MVSSTALVRASIIICTYDEARINDLEKCIASLLKQSVDALELLLVVDHNRKLYNDLMAKYVDPRIRILLNDSSARGQASTMNYGVRSSRAPIVCFIDDDSIADQNWISEILSAYDDQTLSVGGRIEPIWACRRPAYLPKELYWIVGCTGDYLGNTAVETRNLWSSNLSYKATVFGKVGSFLETLGGFGDPLFQGEDAEFGLRVLEIAGKGVRYQPTAIVYHKVGADKVAFRSLLRRCYEQGYAKAYICRLHGNSRALFIEREYLRRLFASSSRRLMRVLTGSERIHAVQQLGFTLLAVTVVLLGFASGLAKAKQ